MDFSILGFGALNPLVPDDFSSWSDFAAGGRQRGTPRNAVFVVIVEGRLGGTDERVVLVQHVVLNGAGDKKGVYQEQHLSLCLAEERG